MLVSRIAVFLLAAVFAGAPLLAMASMGAASCCCTPADCLEDSEECTEQITAASCCEAGPGALPASAKRPTQAPALGAATTLRLAPRAYTPRLSPSDSARDPRALISPLRLSVVLRT